MLELAKDLGWEPYAVEISPFGADICRKIVGDKNVFPRRYTVKII